MVPLKDCNASSKFSLDNISKWFVGSSKGGDLHPAKWLWPRQLCFFAAAQDLYLLFYLITGEEKSSQKSPDLRQSEPRCGIIYLFKDCGIGERSCCSWSKYTGQTLWPKRMLPSWGSSSPAKSFKSVDLPMPFGPIMPILSPRTLLYLTSQGCSFFHRKSSNPQYEALLCRCFRAH